MKSILLQELEAVAGTCKIDTSDVQFPLNIADDVAALVWQMLHQLADQGHTEIKLRKLVDEAKNQAYGQPRSSAIFPSGIFNGTNPNQTLPPTPTAANITGYPHVNPDHLNVRYDPPFPQEQHPPSHRPNDMPWFEDEHQMQSTGAFGLPPMGLPSLGSPSIGLPRPRGQMNSHFDADRDPSVNSTPSMTFFPTSDITKRGYQGP